MVRDWIIGILVAAIVAACGWWVVRHTEWRQETVNLPLKGEARTNPFYAAGKLIERLGGTAVHQSNLEGLPPNGGVLVLTSEYWSLFPQRRASLKQWIEAGGRLIVPEYLIGWDEQLFQWFPVTSVYRERSSAEPSSGETAPQQCPAPDASYKARCPSFVARVWGDDRQGAMPQFKSCELGTHRLLQLSSPLPDGVRPIWSLDSEFGPWVMRLAAGRGSVTVLMSEYPWVRRSLTEDDHAQMWLTLLQFQPGDVVWFVFDEDAPALLAIVWKQGWPVVILLALAMLAAMWRAMTRFGPLAMAPDSARRSLGEQIRGTALFLLRHRRTHVMLVAQARALAEAAERTVPGWQDMSVHNQAQRLAHLTGVDADSLVQALTWAQPQPNRGKVEPLSQTDTAHAIVLLETVRRRLVHTSHSNR